MTQTTKIYLVACAGPYFTTREEAEQEARALRQLGVPDEELTIEEHDVIPFPREADYQYVPGVARRWQDVERHIQSKAQREGFRVFTHDHEDGTYGYYVFATDAEVVQMYASDFQS